MKLLCGQATVVIPLTISANRNAQYNIRQQAGYPAYRCDVVLTINSGILCGCAATGYAIDTETGWVSGSTITIINNGYIEGRGGDGNGNGGSHAIRAQLPISIDNTNGYIRGGGGGGAQGTGSGIWPPGFVGGGGGGGGQGNPGGAGGAPESGVAVPGDYGESWNRAGGSNDGEGGAGGDSGAVAHGGEGGHGGGWGESGYPSGPDSDGDRSYVVGSTGKAVDRGFYTITWLGGYNSTQVKPYPVT